MYRHIFVLNKMWFPKGEQQQPEPQSLIEPDSSEAADEAEENVIYIPFKMETPREARPEECMVDDAVCTTCA